MGANRKHNLLLGIVLPKIGNHSNRVAGFIRFDFIEFVNVFVHDLRRHRLTNYRFRYPVFWFFFVAVRSFLTVFFEISHYTHWIPGLPRLHGLIFR